MTADAVRGVNTALEQYSQWQEAKQAMGSNQHKTSVLYDVAASPYIDLESPFTLWEGVKMALLLPTVPLRLCICVTSIILVAIANSIAIAGCDLSRPLPCWRRRMVELSSQTASGACLRAVGFWNPRVVNYHNYIKGQQMGAIGIFNHVSYLDAFVVVWAFCCAGVTFNFSKHLPILGYGVRALQNLYVPEHKDKASQQQGMVALIKERASNPAMPMLSVAPEGTLSNGRCLLRFKTGAFVAGAPVVPILLRYKLSPFNPSWTIIIPLWHLVRRLLPAVQLSSKQTSGLHLGEAVWAAHAMRRSRSESLCWLLQQPAAEGVAEHAKLVRQG
eukprot:GHRQ01023577.1.p1 GENE.GHRQ01023577.1~~GHRQ01023577.1.p1  ORF type:complete len:331 (+),score=101.62 GHRQ01023577.1:91-1083(+)